MKILRLFNKSIRSLCHDWLRVTHLLREEHHSQRIKYTDQNRQNAKCTRIPFDIICMPFYIFTYNYCLCRTLLKVGYIILYLCIKRLYRQLYFFLKSI